MEAEQIKSNLNIEKMTRGFAVVEDYVNKAIYSDLFIIAFLAIVMIVLTVMQKSNTIYR